MYNIFSRCQSKGILPDTLIGGLFQTVWKELNEGTHVIEGYFGRGQAMVVALTKFGILIGWYYRILCHAIELFNEKGQAASAEIRQGKY